MIIVNIVTPYEVKDGKKLVEIVESFGDRIHVSRAYGICKGFWDQDLKILRKGYKFEFGFDNTEDAKEFQRLLNI